MTAEAWELTEKEKQTLRLMLRGHDAKSIANHLGLSVHTVNERLRNARAKLQVSSSREAARRLFERKGEDPQKLVDSELGDAPAPLPTASEAPRPECTRVSSAHVRSRWILAGGAIMSVVLAVLAFAAAVPQAVPSAAPTRAAASTPNADSPAATAARDFLVLHDQGRWRDCYDRASSAFRGLNSFDGWASAAQQVRPPLGPVLSRVLVSEDNVPTPPAGAQIVKFRTSFANKADVIETLSLIWEDGAWKMAGITME